MKTVQFENAAYDGFVNWATLDKAIFRKITDQIMLCNRGIVESYNRGAQILK